MSPSTWVVDLPTRSVLVHREPRDGRYASVQTLRDGGTLEVAAFPDVTRGVSDLLPARDRQR